MESRTVVVLISADAEWAVLQEILKPKLIQSSPLGEWFLRHFEADGQNQAVVFFHGGWGKIAAAASTQYVIDRWEPSALINLGTCGGFEGQIERGTTLLVDRTIVYDIYEQMGDYDEHIAFYSTQINLDWLSEPYPQEVKRSMLVSADKDLFPEEVPKLRDKYAAVAGDWESGSIAFVAARNGTRCLILRGVTDLVGNQGGEAYGNIALFRQATHRIMSQLIEHLPGWLDQVK